MTLDKVIDQIVKAENVLLLTHEDPDGDALGSLLATKRALEDLGKSVQAVCPDSAPRAFSFLPGAKEIRQDFLLGDYDLVIILDCGDSRRTGFASRLKELSRFRNKIVNIDHHPKNDLHRIARFNLVDFNASSTCEIIYRVGKKMKIKITSRVATCLLCGLYTDTGAFQHSNTNPAVLKIAGELMRLGARLKDISKNITNGRTIPSLKLWGIVLSRLRSDSKLGLVTSFITRDDLKACSATEADLAGAVNVINTIPEARAAILFSERSDGKIKASLRTDKDGVDLSRLAAIFGGGGLKKASGFTIEGRLKQLDSHWQII